MARPALWNLNNRTQSYATGVATRPRQENVPPNLGKLEIKLKDHPRSDQQFISSYRGNSGKTDLLQNRLSAGLGLNGSRFGDLPPSQNRIYTSGKDDAPAIGHDGIGSRKEKMQQLKHALECHVERCRTQSDKTPYDHLTHEFDRNFGLPIKGFAFGYYASVIRFKGEEYADSKQMEADSGLISYLDAMKFGPSGFATQLRSALSNWLGDIEDPIMWQLGANYKTSPEEDRIRAVLWLHDTIFPNMRMKRSTYRVQDITVKEIAKTLLALLEPENEPSVKVRLNAAIKQEFELRDQMCNYRGRMSHQLEDCFKKGLSVLIQAIPCIPQGQLEQLVGALKGMDNFSFARQKLYLFVEALKAYEANK